MAGRKANGQFAAGNRLGRNGGRKARAEEDAVKTALHKAILPTDVLKKLAEAINRRESWAISLYLAYEWGKPKEKHEHDIHADGMRVVFEWADANDLDPTPEAP